MSNESAEKSHKPTAKRVHDFRKRGDIAMSKDLTSVATMLGGVLGFTFGASAIFGSLGEFMRACAMATDGTAEATIVTRGLWTFVGAIVPVVVGSLMGYFISASVQLGWPPALKKPSFDLAKPFKLQSVAQILSPKAAGGRALKSTAKVACVLLMVVLAMNLEFSRFLADPAVTPDALATRIGSAVFRLTVYAIGTLGALALVDYAIQRRSINKKMMMSTDEIKREHKQAEGDPMVKGRRRAKMRELASRRIVAEVKGADVVIVNPTHYAVALRYVAGDDAAPKVVAKGRDEIAERIRAIARAAGVPILSRPPLTRLIYKLVPEGKEIPADVYQAVATVLAFVYGLRSRRTR